MSITSCVSCRLRLTTRRWRPFEINLWAGNRKRKLFRRGWGVRAPMKHFMHRGRHSFLGFFVSFENVSNVCYWVYWGEKKLREEKSIKFLILSKFNWKLFSGMSNERRFSFYHDSNMILMRFYWCTKQWEFTGHYLQSADPTRWLRWHAS